MTKKQKRKNFMKQMATKAIEFCIGDTIYNSIYKAEDWAISQLVEAIKNASTYSVAITKSDIAYHAKYEILSIVKEKYLMMKDTTKVRSWRVLIFRGTPILIIFSKPGDFSRRKETPSRSRWCIERSYSSGISDYYELQGHSSSADFDGDTYQIVNSKQLLDAYKKNSDAVLTFMTINTPKHKKNLKAFYSIIEKKAEKKEKEINKSKYLNLTGYNSATIRKRYMDTVFMNPKTKNEISNSIKSFVNRKDWYVENFVPYHYGILLYGPPGTGKSTLIRAIISEYSESIEKQVNIQYLRSIREINEVRIEEYELELSPKIIIVEDIDASVLKRRTDENEKQLVVEAGGEMPYRRFDEKVSLSEILNTMDGVSNLENVIYIFTTNHIEHLDPALIRPGRIDKLIKVDLPGRDEYDQFMYYHFKKHIPEDFVVKSHKLIAELQNEIVCEKSYEEVLEILGKED